MMSILMKNFLDSLLVATEVLALIFMRKTVFLKDYQHLISEKKMDQEERETSWKTLTGGPTVEEFPQDLKFKKDLQVHSVIPIQIEYKIKGEEQSWKEMGQNRRFKISLVLGGLTNELWKLSWKI